MIARHFWFRSGSYSLLAHLDQPDIISGDTGLLVVPPFGWEDICSHRPLRSLCQHLAEAGIPTLRFDLPGTGDSSGNALATGLVDSWIQSLVDAAAELRAATGVRKVAVLGIRLGALLTLAAASAQAAIDDLILWGGAITGRALLRELRALRSLESVVYTDGEEPPPQPVPGTEIVGFLISPETERALETLNLAPLPAMPDRRVLLLSRDGVPTHKTLVQALERCGCALVQKTGAGYSAMMVFPHQELPPATSGAILEFLDVQTHRKSSDAAPLHQKSPKSHSTLAEGGIVESVCLLPGASGSLFSILSQSEDKHLRSKWCLLFLNSGLVRHIGSNRMWVETARRWALRGISSVRLDFDHVGDSDGDQHISIGSLYEDKLVDQIETATRLIGSQIECDRFIAVGLCSGAYAAFQGLIQNVKIRGAILLNPRIFFWDPAVDQRRLQRRVVSRLADIADWRRLLKGEIRPDRVKLAGRSVLDKLLLRDCPQDRECQIPKKAMSAAWSMIEKSQSRLTLIFSDNEPLFEEMVEERQLPPANNSLIRCLQVGLAGHTFQPLWAQKLLQDLLDTEVERIIRTEKSQPAADGFYEEENGSSFAVNEFR